MNDNSKCLSWNLVTYYMGRFVFWTKWERLQIILFSFVYKPNNIVLFSIVFAFDNVGFIFSYSNMANKLQGQSIYL